MRILGTNLVLAAGEENTIEFDTESSIGPPSSLYINVKDFGAVGDGLTDDYDAILDAISEAESRGGGIVFFPSGQYRVRDGIVLGNGSSTAASTVHHGIALLGEGSGKIGDSGAWIVSAATSIIYDGSTSSGKAVIELRGPLTGCRVNNIHLDANNKAGICLLCDHHYKGNFDGNSGEKYTAALIRLDARASYPSGVSYGNSENSFDEWCGTEPGSSADGIVVTSRGNSVTSPSSCRNNFEGGTIFYGGGTGTAGWRVGYADNNTVLGTLVLPVGGTSGGKDYVFEQVSGSPTFPKENLFLNCSGTRGVSGTSGTSGNAFINLSLDDGVGIPNIANIYATTNLGREYLDGVKLWKEGQSASTSMTGPVSTNSTPATIMTLSLTVKEGARIKITATGRGAKSSSGSGYVYLAHNGTTITGTMDQTDANGYYKPYAKSEVILDSLSAGTHTVALKHHSGDASLTYFADGYLRVTETI